MVAIRETSREVFLDAGRLDGGNSVLLRTEHVSEERTTRCLVWKHEEESEGVLTDVMEGEIKEILDAIFFNYSISYLLVPNGTLDDANLVGLRRGAELIYYESKRRSELQSKIKKNFLLYQRIKTDLRDYLEYQTKGLALEEGYRDAFEMLVKDSGTYIVFTIFPPQELWDPEIRQVFLDGLARKYTEFPNWAAYREYAFGKSDEDE